MASQTNPKDDKNARVKSIFGNPNKLVSELAETSVAVQSLPANLQSKMMTALTNLPEEKQIQAVQALQKEQSTYMQMAHEQHVLGRDALKKLKNLKDKYRQKKQALVEKYEREDAEKKTSNLLNS